MSYLYRNEYKIVPRQAFQILRNCSGCGCKMPYCSTGNFRVNANGNQLDVWLIYQCLKCRHTYNLTIYERVKPTDLQKEEYQSFLNNDLAAALQYGLDKEIFSKNKAEIIWDKMDYEIQLIDSKCYEKTIEKSVCTGVVQEENAWKEVQSKDVWQKIQDKDADREIEKILVLNNPYGLKIRTDRLIADILQMTRSKIKKMIKEGILQIQQNHTGKTIEIKIGGNGDELQNNKSI